MHQDDPQEVTLTLATATALYLCTRMVSHAWVENAKNFFEDVLKSTFRNEARLMTLLTPFEPFGFALVLHSFTCFPLQGSGLKVAFICFLSNFQGTSLQIDAQQLGLSNTSYHITDIINIYIYLIT